MGLEVGTTVAGKVIRIVAEGILVSLPEGKTGLIPLTQGEGQSYFSVGEMVMTQITAREENGRFGLTVVSGRVSDKPTDQFDQEVDRLNHVLKLRNPQLAVRPRTRAPLWEEQLEAWVTQVEQGLSHLREHRRRRLNEAFDKGKEG